MNNFSDKEYQNLRSDTAEIRQCITRYIGYIISVTGFSGVIKFFFNKDVDEQSNLFILSLSLIITTLLFEVIWYKFKSHNRSVGYSQLLMQEMDAIPMESKKDNFKLTKKELENKEYIKNYKDYLDKKYGKGITDFFSWEFVMSRLHGTYFSGMKGDPIKDSLNKSIEKAKFVFSVSDNLYPFIEINEHDIKFFTDIIFPIYLESKSKNFFARMLCYFRFLIITDSKIILNTITIEKRYLVNGWRYPKKITQIGFLTALITYSSFVYSFFKINRGALELHFWMSQWLQIFLFIVTTGFFIYWIRKYVIKLKDLIYGKDSIDFYCWMFFIFRVQLLNNKGVIPVYFSRAFVRYFKTNLYGRILEKNYTDLSTSLEKWVTEKELRAYEKTLNSHVHFSPKQRKIHSILVKSFKQLYPILEKRPADLSLEKRVISAFAESVFEKDVELTPKQKEAGRYHPELDKTHKKERFNIRQFLNKGKRNLSAFFLCDD
tara:strand:- start:10498 stop:11964 length:1467 start_codon:yes stop_codon:yes gene_type:complete